MGCGKDVCLHQGRHSSEKLWTRTLHSYQEQFLPCLPKPSASKCFSVRKGYFVLLVSGKRRKCKKWVTKPQREKMQWEQPQHPHCPCVPPIAPNAVSYSLGLQQGLNQLTSVDNGQGYLFQLPQMCLHVQIIQPACNFTKHIHPDLTHVTSGLEDPNSISQDSGD